MTNQIAVTAAIVTHHNKPEVVAQAIRSFLQGELPGGTIKKTLYLIDNSTDDRLKSCRTVPNIIYHHTGKNIGFGQAHNIAIREAIRNGSAYHLILNPDVSFAPRVIRQLVQYMEARPAIGQVMPRILYPDGRIQYLCKLLPSPFDLLGRRFLPPALTEKRNRRYELQFTGYDTEMDVPSLSGCFMFVRTAVLERTGGFDKRFFMYAEDLDLCRRIGQISRTVYYPEVSIIHHYEKGSYKSLKLLAHHIRSAIRYFNKWGWIRDRERVRINRKLLTKLGHDRPAAGKALLNTAIRRPPLTGRKVRAGRTAY